MTYQVDNPDFTKSPYTGMTRKHWMESAIYMLDGVFKHIKSYDDPIVFPKQLDRAYPKPGDPLHRFRAEKYEGLARTFMLASHVINENEDIQLNGINIREYYSGQILKAVEPKSDSYILKVSELALKEGRHPYQQTVESAALVIGLTDCRTKIWDRYSKEEKDKIAELLTDYANYITVGNNWKFFNVMILTFLKMNGYSIDEDILYDHLQNLLAFYSGDGWYRDRDNYDFYGVWAFQFYGPIWCRWYGYENEPEIAGIIEKRHNELMKTYAMMFGRDSHQQMWGRSIIYRFAASAPFASAFCLKKPAFDAGFARKIASGNILQFLTREDFWVEGIPALGYYGPFEPIIQDYSCTASVFWMTKTYAALALPENSPFWTTIENNGFWDELGAAQNNVMLKGPGILMTSDGKNGTSEIRTSKVTTDYNEYPYYNRLAFNSAFLLEDNAPEGATAMTYSYKSGINSMEHNFIVPEKMYFCRYEAGVLYRKVSFPGTVYGQACVDTADIVIPGGMIRVDRVRICGVYELNLGHFGLPHINGTSADTRKLNIDGKQVITAAIDGRSLALVAYNGWDSVDAAVHHGRNPEADDSTVIFAKRYKEKEYSEMNLLITIMLNRTDNGEWTEEELNPIAKAEILKWTKTGSPWGADLELMDGSHYYVDFANLEGELNI